MNIFTHNFSSRSDYFYRIDSCKWNHSVKRQKTTSKLLTHNVKTPSGRSVPIYTSTGSVQEGETVPVFFLPIFYPFSFLNRFFCNFIIIIIILKIFSWQDVDLSSPTRDQTCAPCTGSAES